MLVFLSGDTIIGIIRKTSTSKTDKIEFGKVSSKIYDEAIDVCFKLDQLQKNILGSKYLKQAFYYSEKNKAGGVIRGSGKF
jgi:hypothetical protein